jgi:hypothetical protein
VDRAVQHELPPADLVEAQELEQPRGPRPLLVEHAPGQVAVHEVDAATDRARLLHARKAPGEGPEIHLQRPAIALPVSFDDRVLHAEVLRHRDLAEERVVERELEVAPPGDARPHGQVEERRAHDALLRGAQQGREVGGAEVHAFGRGRHILEGLHDLRSHEQRLVQLDQPAHQEIEGASVRSGQVVQRRAHSSSSGTRISSKKA